MTIAPQRADTISVSDDSCMLIKKIKTWLSLASKRLPRLKLAVIQHHLGKIIVIAPMALLTVYLVMFSQPRYMSESKVAIKRASEIDSSNLNVGLLLGASNPGSAEDALYLKE
jgi:capsular polysaccharide transport system permease protein